MNIESSPKRKKTTIVYKSKDHRAVFEQQLISMERKSTNRYTASIYLLSSDKKLWNSIKPYINQNHIDFESISCHRLSPHAYTLLKVAQDIYTGSVHLTFNDICDTKLIFGKVFDMIILAFMLGRNEIDISKIIERNKGSEKTDTTKA